MYLKFKKEVAAKYEQKQSLKHNIDVWDEKPSIVSHIETDTAFRNSVHEFKHDHVMTVVGNDTDKMPDQETKDPIHLADINLSLNEKEEQLPSQEDKPDEAPQKSALQVPKKTNSTILCSFFET